MFHGLRQDIRHRRQIGADFLDLSEPDGRIAESLLNGPNCRQDVGRIEPFFFGEFVRVGIDPMFAQIGRDRGGVATEKLLERRQAERSRDFVKVMLGKR
jgi:hypothetical protein